LAALTLVIEFHYGWNRHIWDVEVSALPPGLKLIPVTEVLFDAATSLTKLSMLTLTHRIIGSSSRILRRFVIGVMIWVAVQGTVFMFIFIFQCRHVL
jgi:hypothetical protein